MSLPSKFSFLNDILEIEFSNCLSKYRAVTFYQKQFNSSKLFMPICNNQIKSNVIMKRINFNQRPTPLARGSSRATCENSTKHMWWLVVTAVCTLWFLHLMLLGVCCDTSVPSRAFVMRSPLELIITPHARGSTSHLHPLSAARPGRPVPPVVEGWHSGDSLYYPIQEVESKDGATWELIRGFGYSGSSLPSCPSLSLDNLLYREDFPWSTHRVGVTWVQAGFTGQVLTSRRC